METPEPISDTAAKWSRTLWFDLEESGFLERLERLMWLSVDRRVQPGVQIIPAFGEMHPVRSSFLLYRANVVSDLNV